MKEQSTQLDLSDLRARFKVRSYLNSIRIRRSAVTSGAIETSFAARIGLAAAIICYVVYMGRHSLYSYWGFNFFGFDLGIFDQGVWLLSRFKEPFVTIRGLHLFGDHTSFILLLLTPLYWIHPSASMLLGAQTVALGGAAIPVFLIGRDWFRNEVIALGAAIAYLLHPAVAYTNLENFHPDSFEVPLILFALFFMFRRRWIPCLLFVIATLLVKEDVPLLVFSLGVYIALRLDRKIGAITMALATASLLLNLLVILPAFNELGTLYASRVPTAEFGGAAGFIKAALTRPWDIAAIVLEGDRLWYLFQLLAPLAFLSLGALGLALVAGPPLLANLLTTFGYQHRIEYHYSTLIVPLFVAAAIVGIAKLRDRRAHHVLVTVMVTASVAAAAAWGPLGHRTTSDPNSDRAQAMRAALKTVPHDSVVSAHYSLVPHLSHRQEIYEFPVPWRAQNWGTFEHEGERLDLADRVEIVVVPAETLADEDRAVRDEIDQDFSVIHDEDGILVLSKVRP